MDELTLFTELKPPVPEVGPIQAQARARVVDGLRANRSRGRRFALRAGPASASPGDVGWPLALAAVGGRRLRRHGGAVRAARRRARLARPMPSPGKPDGTVQRLTISRTSPMRRRRPRLQRALRADGISALVWVGSTDQAPADNPDCQATGQRLEPLEVQKARVHATTRTWRPGGTNTGHCRGPSAPNAPRPVGSRLHHPARGHARAGRRCPSRSDVPARPGRRTGTVRPTSSPESGGPVDESCEPLIAPTPG